MALSKTVPGSLIETVVNDTTADDSDKTFTIDKRWRLISIFVSLVTSATVGNRQLTVQILDGSDVVYEAHAGAVQAASGTVAYNFSEGNARETTAVNGVLDVPLPGNFALDPTYSIRVYDSAAIDAAADDMTVRVVAETWK